MDRRRKTTNDVIEANHRVDRRLAAAAAAKDPAEMRRLLRLRKGLRLMLEAVAAK
jgi:hypothetical protein